MDILRNHMQVKKKDTTSVDNKVLNHAMIFVFSQQLLKEYGGEILEKYELLNLPLLLIYMSGKRSMVALNPLFDDRHEHPKDEAIDRAYKDEISFLAALNNAKPFIAYFEVNHTHNDEESDNRGCELCLIYRGTVPVS